MISYTDVPFLYSFRGFSTLRHVVMLKHQVFPKILSDVSHSCYADAWLRYKYEDSSRCRKIECCECRLALLWLMNALLGQLNVRAAHYAREPHICVHSDTVKSPTPTLTRNTHYTTYHPNNHTRNHMTSVRPRHVC